MPSDWFDNFHALKNFFLVVQGFFCLFLNFMWILFFFFNIYVCIYLAVLSLSCGTLDLCCVMWDPSWQGIDSLVVAFRLQRVLTSLVAACWLGFSVACGVLFLWLGIKPTYPALQGVFLISGPPGESPLLYYVDRILVLFNSMLVSFMYMYCVVVFHSFSFLYIMNAHK